MDQLAEEFNFPWELTFLDQLGTTKDRVTGVEGLVVAAAGEQGRGGQVQGPAIRGVC